MVRGLVLGRLVLEVTDEESKGSVGSGHHRPTVSRCSSKNYPRWIIPLRAKLLYEVQAQCTIPRDARQQPVAHGVPLRATTASGFAGNPVEGAKSIKFRLHAVQLSCMRRIRGEVPDLVRVGFQVVEVPLV